MFENIADYGRQHLGWDRSFNQNTSPEALAAWERYNEQPGYDNVPRTTAEYVGRQTEQDAFTAGFDAARATQPLPLTDAQLLTANKEGQDNYSRATDNGWKAAEQTLAGFRNILQAAQKGTQ
jgi:hypothetical protein